MLRGADRAPMPVQAHLPASLQALLLALLLALATVSQLAGALTTGEGGSGPGMGTPLPSSWDVSKSATSLGSGFGLRDDTAPPAAPARITAGRALSALPSSVLLGLEGRRLLLHWGRLQLEGG